MRVLVVEDEPTLAAALVRGLGADGFAVDSVGDGVDALHQATEFRYDAIVMDVMLPGLSGTEVVRELRRRGAWSPVLVLTALDRDEDVTSALDAGADDYLAKPFSYSVLLARLRALLRRGAPQRPVRLTVGDLEVDPAEQRCYRAGSEVCLTAREFAVLEYLARHGEQVVSKTELLEHVWDEHFDGDPNIVEVYVGYLRRKIDVPFGRRSLRTIRGAGYRLGAES
jgi:DNA-binding response OmpR family regulator